MLFGSVYIGTIPTKRTKRLTVSPDTFSIVVVHPGGPLLESNVNNKVFMGNISIALEAYTAEHSKFEVSRNYISISHCYDPVDKIMGVYFDGFEEIF